MSNQGLNTNNVVNKINMCIKWHLLSKNVDYFGRKWRFIRERGSYLYGGYENWSKLLLQYYLRFDRKTNKLWFFSCSIMNYEVKRWNYIQTIHSKLNKHIMFMKTLLGFFQELLKQKFYSLKALGNT